jgi:GDP-D-mannose 3', 5'-epimerase
MAIDWNRKRVLVAGGAGMIGSHMAAELLGRGAYVTVADDLSSGSLQNLNGLCGRDYEFAHYDLRDFERCKQLARGKDAIFQFAADMGGITYITTIGAQIMVNSALININMLRASENVEHYFYSSSACIYPNYLQREPDAPSINLKECDAYPADPNEPYGWEKLFSEVMYQSAQKDWGRNIRIARFHNVYGNGYTSFDDDKAKAPCKMIAGAIKGEIEIWNDGNQTRSFLYIDDCIDAVLRLMDSDVQVPINIGSDRAVSMKELARLVIGASGKNPCDIKVTYHPEKPMGVRGRNADLTLVERLLGWRPKVEMEDGLREVYQWAIEHQGALEGVKWI